MEPVFSGGFDHDFVNFPLQQTGRRFNGFARRANTPASKHLHDQRLTCETVKFPLLLLVSTFAQRSIAFTDAGGVLGILTHHHHLFAMDCSNLLCDDIQPSPRMAMKLVAGRAFPRLFCSI